MARPSGEKNRCGGRWTEAKFNSFVTSGLRSLTKRWGPKSDAKKNARVRRGWYLCAGCDNEVPASVRIGGKKLDNAVVDHIKPVVDPQMGHEGWDRYINSLLCEEDNLQVLCHECHTTKSNKERQVAVERRRGEKMVRELYE